MSSRLGPRVVPVIVVATAFALIAAGGCRDVYVRPLRWGPGGAGGDAGGAASGGRAPVGGASGVAGDPDTGGVSGSGGASGTGGAVDCPPSTLIGFAAVDGGTTGGEGGPVMVARTMETLKDLADTTGPMVIRIDGMIQTSGLIDISSDKTVEGVGKASGLVGGGLRVKESRNIIIRNLIITKAVAPADAIQLLTATNVWIDHCDLSSDLANGKTYYDGLVDISHAADDITVSWTRFHDHFHASLIGHSNDNGPEDTGHLNVTFHHNLFDNTQYELPRVRFGHAHVFNNHYRNVGTYAIASQMGAAVLVERNLFENVTRTLLTHFEDPTDGTMHESENKWIASGASEITADTAWRPTYPYTGDWDSMNSVALVVDACAGVAGP